MLNVFYKYAGVGIANTAIHWVVFAVFFYWFSSSQSLANFVAFCFAITFSFFVNARWTFSSDASLMRYSLYVIFMGGIACFFGWSADQYVLSPIVTLIGFSAVSLICGFFYSKLIVFR
ncbi:MULTISPECIES: GtrA family protein [Pantoea]|jgi:putative flippase GtrA|uniref:Bactoprenol-linked glucose translocase n=2 Tax=root TaxID=1 RepID=A0A7Y6TQS2_9GAMM|nr:MULTISPECIES: GtrA family protein [Pantoea]MBZ6393736.1 GtrA family protein [Pantoea sp.]MBZ6437281.1 GtrA family protein [Pantoea sp.]NUY40465.1 GtrA family protein [Pantoea brenneri]NUY47451.1 GtrA family protein [Pantoea brenneri]NUY57778.1 GtrA family protein [Pantoea brenneri]